MKLLKEQIDASSPHKNVWLSANAGTGKTFVLVNRLLRLLLDDNEPHRIVCITYTKAAAAEMQNRIIENISELILMSDAEIKTTLEAKFEESFDPAKIKRCRKKLANILDFPDQLKIQTIHSFCQSILKSFPLEANIPPFFNVIDDIATNELIEDAWNRLINNIEGAASKNAIDILLSKFNIKRIKSVFKDLIGDREKLFSVIEENGGIAGYLAFLKERLNIQNANALEIEDGFYNDSIGFLSQLAQILPDGGMAQQRLFKYLCNYFQSRKLDDLYPVFLNEKGENKVLLNKELKQGYPLIEAEGKDFAAKLKEATNKIKDIEIYENTEATLISFLDFYANFESLKKQKYLLDYDDLITRTVALLHPENPNSQWVLYKLDGGVDHILLDEAQDTNQAQWKVITALTEEFFSGRGAKEKTNRSLFVVGDEKQSIYSFQGANVVLFNSKKQYFEAVAAENKNVIFETISLNKSFRSCEAVLNIVDAVLWNEKVRGAVSKADIEHKHELDRKNGFGYFEINEISGNDIKRNYDKEPISWRLPREYNPDAEEKNKEIVAQDVVNRIDEILNRGHKLASTGKLPQPADIMILLKKRDEISDHIIRKLQEKNITVSGIDRLKLKYNLAIKDLIALGKFALLENDDLNFACLLKSPIFEISEEELFEICWNRGELSVFENLKNKAANNKNLKEVYEKVLSLKKSLNKNSVFEFFFNAVEVHNLRRNFISYFGTQINEILDEFLSVVKNYESNESPSLQHFMGWFERSEIEVKRNLNNSQGEVRILTVHGSKGLEAPIVIIPDATSTSLNSPIYSFSDDGVFLCPVLAEYRNEYFDEISKANKKADEDEYYRLLYVALTRARDELYVFGYKAPKRNSVENWHNIIISQVGEMCEKQDNRFVYSRKDYLEQTATSEKPKESTKKAELRFEKYIENNLELISPSGLYKTDGDTKLKLQNIDFSKGLAVHRLLEILPDVEEEKRNAVADIILNNFPELDAEQRKNILREALGVLNNKEFEFIFSRQSKAEVPVCGIIGNKFVSGKIDRLVDTGGEILVVDYKTNNVSADKVDAVAAKYTGQLNAYRTILQKIYPDKNIKTALLFTAIEKLVHI